MKIVSGEKALKNIRRNPMSIWWGNEPDAGGANTNYAGNRVKHPFPNLLVKPKFDIEPGCSVYALGSCFAREIESALGETGFEVLSFDPDVFCEPDFKSSVVWGASNFLNRYTTASMLLEIQRLLSSDVLAPNELLLRQGDRALDLHYTGSCEAGDCELALRRRAHAWRVGQGLRRAELVVLTLGLTEAWFDTHSGKYVNSGIDLLYLRRESSRFELHNLDFQSNLANLEQIRELLTRDFPDRKIVITVSPVPLQATFNSEDIVVANMNSKATLRAVAAEFCRKHEDVLYFPSFEIVSYSNPSVAWQNDRRHVTRQMVSFIIDTFRAAHGLLEEGDRSKLLTDLDPATIDVSGVQPDGLEIAGDEIALHPFDRAMGNAQIVFRNVDLKDHNRFESSAQVVRDDCETVEFGLRLFNRVDGSQMFGRSIEVAPGSCAEFATDFPDDLPETADLCLYTRMAGKSGSSANAWSKFLGPRIVNRRPEVRQSLRRNGNAVQS